MQLNADEQTLINVLRALPPVETKRVLDWARQLADEAAEQD